VSLVGTAWVWLPIIPNVEDRDGEDEDVGGEVGVEEGGWGWNRVEGEVMREESRRGGVGDAVAPATAGGGEEGEKANGTVDNIF